MNPSARPADSPTLDTSPAPALIARPQEILLSAYSVSKNTVLAFFNDKCPRLGAALAFYTALSLSPLLVIVVAILGAIYGADAAAGQLAHQIRDFVGGSNAKLIESLLASSQHKSHGLIATLAASAILIVGATGAVAGLQDALNTIFGTPPDEGESTGRTIWIAVRDRLLSFAVVCAMAFLLAISLLLSALLHGVGRVLDRWFPHGEYWLGLGNWVLATVIVTAMFAVIFKVLPYKRPTWSMVWRGAIVTSLLFAGGKTLIGYYLGHTAVGSAYGAAGSFVAFLVWVYYSTQILLFGAEFTKVDCLRRDAVCFMPTSAPQ